MIKISLTIKKKNPGEKGVIITTNPFERIQLKVIRDPKKRGIIRLKSLFNSRDRLKNGQLVITADGLGSVKEYLAKKDEQGRLILPNGVNIAVRNLKYKSRIYNLKDTYVVDIIENRSGNRYPAAESDYSFLLVDDAPVEFIVTRKNKAMLTVRSKKELEPCKLFAKKQNGIKLLNQLIEKGIWTPIKK